MDDTNLWDGLDSEDDLESASCKTQEGVNRWGGPLKAVGVPLTWVNVLGYSTT